MNTPPLLVELLTEELPPKTLRALAADFGKELTKLLRQDGFLSASSSYEFFATPRRLAVYINDVLAEALSREVVAKGPSVSGGLDTNGKPTPALLGFAKKRGVAVEALEQIQDGKQKVFAHRAQESGGQLHTHLPAKIEAALKSLPIPKIMSYQLADGESTVRFARPAHRLVVLHGKEVVPANVLGISADRVTEGHRFQSKAREITLAHAGEYEQKLHEEGMVIANFDIRRAEIEKQLRAQAAKLSAALGPEQDVAPLLDEVTALVEWPAVYVGEFDKDFLSVPQECLVLTMRANQKYFPLFDTAGKLTHRFLIVSNMRLDDPRPIIEGNQRVVRPRLADARFFFETDKKIKLADRVPQLASIVYHNKLGSQLDRVNRVVNLSEQIARVLNNEGLRLASEEKAKRAAFLCKADLLTNMVSEFPELQGVMGTYYALHEGEEKEVAHAIEEHYYPRFSGDDLPETMTGAIVALADKLDSLFGIFSVGQIPTGDRDPFGLRRQALGVLRILIEKELPLSIVFLFTAAVNNFPQRIDQNTQDQIYDFLLDRLRTYLRDQNYTTNEIEAVVARKPERLNHEIIKKILAVRNFVLLPEAESLATANKRIGNILKKADLDRPLNKELFSETSEKILSTSIENIKPEIESKFAHGDYTGMLKSLSTLKVPVDSFFDEVMVMDENPDVRANRIALLRDLHALMNRVADISKLAN